MMDAGSSNPLGRAGWGQISRGGSPVSGAQSSGPVFPRSGWNDGASLSGRAQDALNTLHNDYSGTFNWRRRPGGTTQLPSLPDMAAMYGMAFPPKDGKPQPSNPTLPPDMAAMYGMAFPPKTDLPSNPGNPVLPPDMAAMYGMAFPPKHDGFNPGSPVSPPDMAAMYGLAFPNRG